MGMEDCIQTPHKRPLRRELSRKTRNKHSYLTDRDRDSEGRLRECIAGQKSEGKDEKKKDVCLVGLIKLQSSGSEQHYLVARFVKVRLDIFDI